MMSMKTDWQPVTDRTGTVLGWMAAPDPDEPDVDCFQVGRLRKVRLRADQLAEVSALFGEECMDPEQVWDAGLAAGLTDFDLDAAAHIALVLQRVEYRLD
jgi:hypothetical protein